LKAYWDKRFAQEGMIWGETPSRTAEHALEVFRAHGVKSVLVPGSGYGRNTKLFSSAGMAVTGVEISEVAHHQALEFDPASHHVLGSVLDMPVDGPFDAIYCFNVLHLFRKADRRLFVQECADRLIESGLAFFTVFSEKEASFGRGNEVEENTFESKPGRPVHYFTEADLRAELSAFNVIETGLAEDAEDHGEGPHVHLVRYAIGVME
jgi:SAM-dependent methyltransferase